MSGIRGGMTDRRRRFEAEALVHLDAAYNLARWLARAPADADDVVQEAMLRAWRAWDDRRGADVRPWLLAIVRNCFYTSAAQRARETGRSAGEEALEHLPAADGDGPLAASMREQASRALNAALASLAVDFREVLVLREIEELSYREIATVLGVPIGTVMSRLARARAAMRAAWPAGLGGPDELP